MSKNWSFTKTSFQVESTLPLVCNLWSFSVFYSYNCLQTKHMFWRHQACTDLLDQLDLTNAFTFRIDKNILYCLPKPPALQETKNYITKKCIKLNMITTDNQLRQWMQRMTLQICLSCCSGCAQVVQNVEHFLNFATLMCIQMQSLAKSMSSNNNVWSTSGYGRLNLTIVQFSSRPSFEQLNI